MAVKYIDICSTYRNRNLYPNPSNFLVAITYDQNPITNAFMAQDPVVNAVPSVISTLQAGSTFTNIVLNASASAIDNFYVDDLLEIGGVIRKIISYNGTSKTATVEAPGFAGPPGAGTTYYIRGAYPIFTSTIGAGSTTNLVNLGVGASSTDNAYTGQYIYFLPGGTCAGTTMLIIAYNGTTKIATMFKGLPAIPALGDDYEIDAFTKDNFTPLLYSGTQGFNQSICYTMDLLYLTIPNQLTKSGYGGNLSKYPFLYLHLYNEGSVMRSDAVLYSNNPNAKRATFKIPLGLNLNQETFFTLKDAKCIQTIKFKPDQPIRFTLTLPNGEPVTFATADNLSPLEPNPLLQISGCFAIRRMDGN
jgi:hypothetical protein